MPTDIGVIDLMMGIPDGPQARTGTSSSQAAAATRSPRTSSSRRSTCSRTCPQLDERRSTPSRLLLEQMDQYGIEQGHDRRRASTEDRATTRAGARGAPRPLLRQLSRSTRTGAWTRVRDLEQRGRGARREGGDARSPRAATRRCRSTTRSSIPIYAKCIELDIPICVCAGVPGPRVPFAPPGRRR